MRAPAWSAGAALAAVPRWSQAPALDDHALQRPLYPCDHHLNHRLAIWNGDITSLEVDAITNTTDETLTECNAISERIMQMAGPELKEEIITRGLECRTGEVVVTPGFMLRCRHVIHTVSPKYVAKYHTAAETSLQNCYKNVLNKAAELGVRTLALCVINTPRRNFPSDLASHIALRAVRRHLSSSSRPSVVVVWGAAAALSSLRCAAPLYFPRSPAPAPAPAPSPPPPDLHDRRIRIIHNPHDRGADTAEDDTSLCDEEAAAEAAEAAAAFARACAPDTQRLLAPAASAPTLQRRLLDDHEQYDRLLRRARTEDLSEVSGIGCLYQSGVDRLGRPVVVFIGKWFPIGDIDLDKALLYLIKLLDPIVRGDYVIAYFHTLASSANHPPFSWLKEVYTVLPYKYKKNLKAFYIVHPTFWTKMMTWWFTTFMAPAIKAKVHTLPGVEFLYSVMARDQLEVPAFVTEYDMTINGLHYFQPDTNNT
ncbi:protein GDAP2 homolog isoform X2 [Achroia grisella]|uniref:protein GDAP2 homolog isoform X2 n=1 Tax=Achroia grisella TaxID=688607 RepID=UPI0027D27756|nr:protein GDAP2 homolog isoform X2 [Achroia grisella]